GQLNQGFAKVSVAAIGASLILWGVALWATRGFARLPAAAGVIIGAVLALGVLTGWLNLTASGIVIVTLLQGIWIILVAAHLLREGSNGRNVYARTSAAGRAGGVGSVDGRRQYLSAGDLSPGRAAPDWRDDSADVLYYFGDARRFLGACGTEPLRASQLDCVRRMVQFRAYGGHGADGDSTAHQTRRAAGWRGCDRPGGRAAVRAHPSEGDGLGHLLTAPLPFAALRAGSSGEGERMTNCHSSPLGDYNCLDYARPPCGDSPVSTRRGRQGVQLRPHLPLRDGGRWRARGDDCVPGDVPHGLLARAQALARGIRGTGRA